MAIYGLCKVRFLLTCFVLIFSLNYRCPKDKWLYIGFVRLNLYWLLLSWVSLWNIDAPCTEKWLLYGLCQIKTLLAFFFTWVSPWIRDALVRTNGYMGYVRLNLYWLVLSWVSLWNLDTPCTDKWLYMGYFRFNLHWFFYLSFSLKYRYPCTNKCLYMGYIRLNLYRLVFILSFPLLVQTNG